MPTKDDYDRYAAELVRRFEDFTTWAIEHWPDPESPLMDSDFAASRKEIAGLVGPRLGGGHTDADPGAKADDSTQFVNVTPMPWP
ncbi:MAG: hypothetical protein ACTHL1_10470 [Burkholderiaceae bacterium]